MQVKNMMRRLMFVSALTVGSFLYLSPVGLAQQVGEPLRPWSSRTLDIHQINTGSGNSAFLIFPDGTTLLVDAGDLRRARGSTPKPNELKSTQGHVVVRVDPGGESYRVLVLDEAAETFSVKAAHGPYQA
jgi:hypothetical protein